MAEEPISLKVTLSVRARRSLCTAFWSATVTGVVGVNVTVLVGFGTAVLRTGGSLTTRGVDDSRVQRPKVVLEMAPS